jgi:hypothetical protein
VRTSDVVSGEEPSSPAPFIRFARGPVGLRVLLSPADRRGWRHTPWDTSASSSYPSMLILTAMATA